MGVLHITGDDGYPIYRMSRGLTSSLRKWLKLRKNLTKSKVTGNDGYAIYLTSQGLMSSPQTMFKLIKKRKGRQTLGTRRGMCVCGDKITLGAMFVDVGHHEFHSFVERR